MSSLYVYDVNDTIGNKVVNDNEIKAIKYLYKVNRNKYFRPSKNPFLKKGSLEVHVNGVGSRYRESYIVQIRAKLPWREDD